jgi:hypothetical protein
MDKKSSQLPSRLFKALTLSKEPLLELRKERYFLFSA